MVKMVFVIDVRCLTVRLGTVKKVQVKIMSYGKANINFDMEK